MSETPKKVGRPCKFNERLSLKIIELTEAGKTVKEVAEITGVGESTLYLWFSEKPEFLESLKEARQSADELVEASLFRKAIGYRYIEDAMSKMGPMPIEKQAHPDTTAAIFWLKNRQPDKWREKSEVEQTVKISGDLGAWSDLKKPEDE